MTSTAVFYYLIGTACLAGLSHAQGTHLRIGVLAAHPIASQFSENGTYYGFGIDVWNQVVQIMNTNFKYNVTYSFLPVDSMYNVASLLFTEELDLVIYGIIPPPNIYRILNTTVPYLDTVLHTISLIPINTKTTFVLAWSVFIDATFLAFLFLISIFAIISAHIVWTIERRANKDFPTNYKLGIGHSLYWAWSTISLVGFGDVNPRSGLGKALTVSIVIFSLVLLNIFSGVVCSFVTTGSLEPISPTRDAFSGVSVAAINNSYAVYFLQVVNAEIVEVDSISEGISLVANATVDYFISDQISLIAHNLSDPTLEISGPSFDNLSFTFLYSSSSNFSPNFTRDLDRSITLLQFTHAFKAAKINYFSYPTGDTTAGMFKQKWVPAIACGGVLVLYFIWFFVYHVTVSSKQQHANSEASSDGGNEEMETNRAPQAS